MIAPEAFDIASESFPNSSVLSIVLKISSILTDPPCLFIIPPIEPFNCSIIAGGSLEKSIPISLAVLSRLSKISLGVSRSGVSAISAVACCIRSGSIFFNITVSETPCTVSGSVTPI